MPRAERKYFGVWPREAREGRFGAAEAGRGWPFQSERPSESFWEESSSPSFGAAAGVRAEARPEYVDLSWPGPETADADFRSRIFSFRSWSSRGKSLNLEIQVDYWVNYLIRVINI